MESSEDPAPATAAATESTLDRTDVDSADLIQVDTANGDLRPDTSQPANDSGAEDATDEDGEFDNDFPDMYYYNSEELDEPEPEHSTAEPQSNEAEAEGATENSATSATTSSSLQDTMASCDWSSVHLMLNSATSAMTLDGIKQALVKAIETNNAPTICQLLPLLPESPVCVRGWSAVTHAQGSLGNTFLPSFLSSAIKSGNLEAARALIRGPESTAGCKQLGETNLILAVQPGSDVRFVKEFLENSCVNAQDLHGRTAVSYAAQHGLAKIVRFLVKEAGADPKIEDSQGWTPLNYAYAALENQPTEEQRIICSDIIEYLT